MNIITNDIKLILRHKEITSGDIELLLRLVKRNCYRIYQLALKNGDLKRPELCQVCNTRKALYGHHKSYLKPLKVTWLCGLHHRQVHSKSVVDNFNLISSLVGKNRAEQIRRLMLPTNQTSAERVKRLSTITGSVEGDKILWKARIKHCGKACLKVCELANKQLFTSTTYKPMLLNIEQTVEIALGSGLERETFITRAIERSAIQKRMEDAGFFTGGISCCP